MGVSINPKTSGFRKWAEIHEPTKIDEVRTGANKGDVNAAADVRQDNTTSDQWASPLGVEGRDRSITQRVQ